jgi:hypothetical protein
MKIDLATALSEEKRPVWDADLWFCRRMIDTDRDQGQVHWIADRLGL